MASARIPMTPSTGLSGSLVFLRTQSSLKEQTMKNYQHNIDAQGEV